MKKIVQLLFCVFVINAQISIAQDSDNSNRRRPAKSFMGVSLGTNWGDGVELSGVTKGYGAERAGLLKGDIIVAVNSEKIGNDKDLNRAIQKYKPGTEVEVAFLRGKEKKTLSVKLAESPNGYNWIDTEINQEDLKEDIREAMEDAAESLREVKEDLRENIEDIREDLKDNYRMTEKAMLGIYPQTNWSKKAVCITGFTEKSAAKKAGLEKEDLILKIDKDEINTEEELRYALKKHQPNDEITVVYSRNGKQNEVKVTLGAEKVYEGNRNIYYNNSEGWGSSYSKNDGNNETRTWSSYTFADGTQVDLNDFKITPSANTINLSFEAKLNQPFSIVIYDNNGKEVLREEQPKLDGKFEKNFTISDVKSDTYFAKIWIAGKEAFSQKIEMPRK
jgi:predicted metalloprotease with PDZ domain